MPVPRELLSVRFWRYISPEPNTGCWLWAGTADSHGYGQIPTRAPGGRHRKLRASRVGWELEHGPVPDGLCVLHRCDTPACCNPAHLFLGTQTDNLRDCVAKGRHGTRTVPRCHAGTQNGRAKLSDNDVREMRRAYDAGEANTVQLAARFGVASSGVARIVKRLKWTHVE